MLLTQQVSTVIPVLFDANQRSTACACECVQSLGWGDTWRDADGKFRQVALKLTSVVDRLSPCDAEYPRSKTLVRTEGRDRQRQTRSHVGLRPSPLATELGRLVLCRGTAFRASIVFLSPRVGLSMVDSVHGSRSGVQAAMLPFVREKKKVSSPFTIVLESKPDADHERTLRSPGQK